jgi:hypothetical protein
MLMQSRLLIAVIAVFLGVVANTHAIPTKPVPNFFSRRCISLFNFDVNAALQLSPLIIPGVVSGCYCLNDPTFFSEFSCSILLVACIFYACSSLIDFVNQPILQQAAQQVGAGTVQNFFINLVRYPTLFGCIGLTTRYASLGQ